MAPATDPGRGARGTREDTCLVFAATSAVINSRDQRREEEEQLTGQDSSTASLEICCPSSSTTSTIASLSSVKINQNLLLFVHIEYHENKRSTMQSHFMLAEALLLVVRYWLVMHIYHFSCQHDVI